MASVFNIIMNKSAVFTAISITGLCFVYPILIFWIKWISAVYKLTCFNQPFTNSQSFTQTAEHFKRTGKTLLSFWHK